MTANGSGCKKRVWLVIYLPHFFCSFQLFQFDLAGTTKRMTKRGVLLTMLLFGSQGLGYIAPTSTYWMSLLWVEAGPVGSHINSPSPCCFFLGRWLFGSRFGRFRVMWSLSISFFPLFGMFWTLRATNTKRPPPQKKKIERNGGLGPTIEKQK